jgi:hypothetical protein
MAIATLELERRSDTVKDDVVAIYGPGFRVRCDSRMYTQPNRSRTLGLTWAASLKISPIILYPTGRFFLRTSPGTSCQATIGVSLRDALADALQRHLARERQHRTEAEVIEAAKIAGNPEVFGRGRWRSRWLDRWLSIRLPSHRFYYRLAY